MRQNQSIQIIAPNSIAQRIANKNKDQHPQMLERKTLLEQQKRRKTDLSIVKERV